MKNYNATVAKIRAMYGKRITSSDYGELVSSRSVSEIAEYLKKNTHYSGTLSSVDTSSVHRGFLESLLRKSVYETYLKITGFEKIGRQEFYNYRIILAEIDVILSCIRNINARSESGISDIPIYLNGMTCFDLIEIARIRTFPELLDFLRKTPYYDVLAGETADENGNADYTVCEVKMRCYYFERLKKFIDKRGGAEAKALNLMIMTDVDLINVINSYRMKRFFGGTEEEIESIMLPFGSRLSPEKRRDIYSSENEADFIRRFSKTFYGRQLAEMGRDFSDMEEDASRLRYIYAKRALKNSSSAAVSVYAFLYLMTIEVQNLISIIEGVRYGVSSKQIESLIII